MKTALEKNKEYSQKYVQKVSNPKLQKNLRNFISNNGIKKVVDLGCGDGSFISALKLFDNSIKVTGIDISERRVNGLKNKFPKEKLIIADVCNTGLKENFDFVHSSQVIEHVEKDNEMVEEIKRFTKPDGYVYVSTVIKKPWAIYKYRNKGKFVLDPTHEREYRNQKEFLDLFKEDFKLITSRVYPVRRKFLKKSIKIPGFFIVEGLWQKRK